MRCALYNILISLFIIIGMTSCVESPDLVENPVFDEGSSRLSLSVEFRPMASQLTRTEGDAIKHIKTLHVVVYKDNGELYGLYPISSFNQDEPVSPDNPNTDPENFAESTTCRATFDMDAEIPFGRYRFYVVANYTPTEAQVATEEKLRNISLTWNSSDIAANNAMFGFFTASEEVPSLNELRGSAPTLTINQQQMSLYAWVRRAVSKVTVAFDGTNLYENIYIYIHTVQIKDIPTSCLLGADNTPDSSSELIANGETIYHRPKSSSDDADGLCVTKGVPSGTLKGVTVDNNQVHSETANALYFYENMQGTDENKHEYNNFPSKDNKPYGSYIEVKGYYVNKTADAASQGDIIYRFMLGKDIERDFNAERNNHYKLTLKFKNNANDPDWHIVYEPESPEISVPTPLYISYGYNEYLDIPVIVRSASANANTTLKAQITHNPWGYPEHKYYSSSNHTGNEDGFLSFEDTKGTVSISEDQRNNNWVGTKTGIKPTTVNVDGCKYTVRVYTRPLILGNSLTGHNPYVSYDRRAKVKFTVTLNGKTYTQEMEVIQVKRLVNPTGVWRSNDNTSKFNIRLMELNESDTNQTTGKAVNVTFYAPLSDGPWTAHIEEGADWVQIAPTGTNQWGAADVVGGTGTEIRFDYRPGSVNNTGNVRCGVIRVTYHNNTCVHYVFVSQGNGTVNLAGTNWQNRNVLKKDQLVDNPLLEGCMFKFGNTTGIYAENNHRSGYGFQEDCWGKTFNTTAGTITFESITSNLTTGFTGNNKIMTNTSIKPSTYAQWAALETLHRRYGVLYGDECSETQTTTDAAYSYYSKGQQRGMQGMFVWDESKAGNHIFFPIGSTGNGHRQVTDNVQRWTTESKQNIPYSVLKYAQRSIEMQPETSVKLPMYYDLWIRKGGIYWYDVKVTNAREYQGTTDLTAYSHDINFHTMLLQTYSTNGSNVYDKNGTLSSDAMYIRCVEN